AVRLEDPGLRLDDLAERPVRHPLAVGKGAALAPDDQLRVVLDDAGELVDEPALADPGHPGERDELGLALLPGAREGGCQQVELALAADERRAPGLEDVD